MIAASVTPEMFIQRYQNVFTDNQTWNDIPGTESEIYDWDADSTYIQEPPFFTDLTRELPESPRSAAPG